MHQHRNIWNLYGGKENRDKVLNVIWSVFIILAINSNEMLMVGAESENAVLNFVSKLSEAFSTYNFVDILSFAAVYALIRFVSKERKSLFDGYGTVLSAVLTFLYLWSFSYKSANDTSILFSNTFQVFLLIVMFIGWFLLFYFGFLFLCILLERSGKKEVPKQKAKTVFMLSAGTIFIGWLPWLLMNYPGSISPDTNGQLGQYFGGSWNAHHPPLSTWLMGSAVELGELFIDRNFGMFLYLLIQAVFGSLVLAYGISKIYKMGVGKGFCIFTVLFFAFTPIFGLYAQWMQKDMLYSIFALLYTILMIDFIQKKELSRKRAVLFFIVGMAVCLLRKNGMYYVIPSCFALAVFFRETFRKRMLLITFATFAAYFLISGMLYPALSIDNGNIREALCVPMQQSARYVRDYGEELTEEEKEALEGFSVSYLEFPQVYSPTTADPIKDIVNTEIENMPRYFATWFKMGLKHPGVYFDAFMNMNYGYLAPNEQNVEPNLSDFYDEQITNMGFSRRRGDIPIRIFYYLVRINVVFPILRYLTMPGIYTWIVIVSTVLLIKYKCKTGLVLLVPEIMTVIVCLASPLCNGMRYELPVVFAFPLLLAWVWWNIRKEVKTIG